MNEPHMPNAAPENQSGGKVALGCGLGCLVMVLIVGVVTFLGVRTIQGRVDEFANAASSEPVKFEYPTVQAAEAEAVINRFDEFKEAISSSSPTKPLVLSANDLNILIAQHPSLEFLVGRVLVDIVDDKILTQVSFKPEDFPIKIPFITKAFKGKYLNGSAKADLSIKDDEARLYLKDLEFSGSPVPPEIGSVLEQENMMKNLLNEPEFKDFLEKIKEIKVEGGALNIIPQKIQE